MRGDRITANLPSRDFDATSAFYGALGFASAYRSDGWMILTRGPLELEFFPHPDLVPEESWFSACIRIDDIDAAFSTFSRAGLNTDPAAIPRVTPPVTQPDVPRYFALVDPDGSLLRVLENGAAR